MDSTKCLFISFALSLPVAVSTCSAQQASHQTILEWTHELKVPEKRVPRLPLIQEETDGILAYTHFALWRISWEGSAVSVLRMPKKLVHLMNETFYYREKSRELLVVKLPKPLLISRATLFSYNAETDSVVAVLAFPDFGLRTHQPTPFQFEPDWFRVAYWANENVYYFKVDLDSKKVRGYISRFPEHLTYVLLADSADMYYMLAARSGSGVPQLLLYDPQTDQVMWEMTEPVFFGDSVFMNSKGETLVLDSKGQGFFIDLQGRRVPSKTFRLRVASKRPVVDRAVSPDKALLCFLSSREIVMVNPESGDVLWRMKNDFGAKRIVRFDQLGVILDRSNLSVPAFRAISVDGKTMWDVEIPDETPNFISVIRHENRLILVSETTKDTSTIKCFRVQRSSTE